MRWLNKIKICGLTRPEDALLAHELGASALGMICYEESPRNVNVSQIKKITDAVGGLAHLVAVVVNPSVKQVEQLTGKLGVNTIQFHGDETPEFCAQFGVSYFKALRVKHGLDIDAQAAKYTGAHGILLDTYAKNAYGGTGKSFNWKQAASLTDPRIIVAGGLTPENIDKAMQQSQARAFDLSSGVESEPGIKDPNKLAALFEAIRRV